MLKDRLVFEFLYDVAIFYIPPTFFLTDILGVIMIITLYAVS